MINELLLYVLTYGHSSLFSSLCMCGALLLRSSISSSYLSLREGSQKRGGRGKQKKKGKKKRAKYFEGIDEMSDEEWEKGGDDEGWEEGGCVGGGDGFINDGVFGWAACMQKQAQEEEDDEEEVGEGLRDEDIYGFDLSDLPVYSTTKSCIFLMGSVASFTFSSFKSQLNGMVRNTPY